MSVYNHHAMLPPSAAPNTAPPSAAQGAGCSSNLNRVTNTLDKIRQEFDHLSQQNMYNKSQKDDYENKIALQIKEMHKFQQTIYEMERSHQAMKRQYEDEIARLRQQIDSYSVSHLSIQQQQHLQQGRHQSPLHFPPPNTASSSSSSTLRPELPQIPSFMGASPISSSTTLQHQQQRSRLGSPRTAGAAATPNSNAVAGMISANTSSAIPSISSPTTTTSLNDIDPLTIPDALKMEGSDWFAIFNPQLPRTLSFNLYKSIHHKSVVCCVKFSLDGRYLAAGCNRVVHIYDLHKPNGGSITLQDHNLPEDGDLYIRSVCFSPDGRYLATGAEDKLIRIWDVVAQRITSVLQGHEQDIYSLDFSRDGALLISGSGDRTTRIWSMADMSCRHILSIKDYHQSKDPGVTSVAISSSGRLIATGSLDKIVRIWDAYTGHLLEKLEGHRDSVYSVAFMPGDNEVVSGSLDKTLKLWRLGTADSSQSCKMTFTGHKDFVLSVTCSHDGKWIISGSKDRTIQFWDPNTGLPLFMLQGHKNSVISVAVSTSGKPLFASGSGDSCARLWEFL